MSPRNGVDIYNSTSSETRTRRRQMPAVFEARNASRDDFIACPVNSVGPKTAFAHLWRAIYKLPGEMIVGGSRTTPRIIASYRILKCLRAEATAKTTSPHFYFYLPPPAWIFNEEVGLICAGGVESGQYEFLSAPGRRRGGENAVWVFFRPPRQRPPRN